MEAIELTLHTLTPIWTGGIEAGKMDRLHETSLIGSLRWWYGMIKQGQGEKICDPTQQPCQLSGSNLETFERERQAGKSVEEALTEATICPVCQLFGCTGWKRQFQLTLQKDSTRPGWSTLAILNIRPPDRSRGWFLPAGRVGSLSYRLHGPQANTILNLLHSLAEWGTIGAKPQLGYGRFRLETATAPTAKLPQPTDFGFFSFRFMPPKPNWWLSLPGIERLLGSNGPELSQLAANKMLPLTPILKNAWRYKHWQGAPKSQAQLFGTLAYERIRSKVAVSWAYFEAEEWEMRGWVWLPPGLNAGNLLALLANQELWQTTLGLSNGGNLTLSGNLAKP